MDWRVTKRNRLAEKTHSGCGGKSAWHPGVSENQFTFSCIWDSVATPESLSLDEGDEVELVFKHGAAAVTDTYDAIIETLEKTCNNQTGVVTYNCTARETVPDS